jgi:hypothetical protein
MQKAVGREREIDRCYQPDGDPTTRSASGGFLLTAFCLLFSLCLCGRFRLFSNLLERLRENLGPLLLLTQTLIEEHARIAQERPPAFCQD